jgi:hypothetical protein
MWPVSADSSAVFIARDRPAPGLEVVVNFELATGRAAMLAEIDRLAAALLELVDHVSIVASTRHEIGMHAESRVHQVVIEIDAERLMGGDAERTEMGNRVAETAAAWVDDCAADRAVGL